MLRALLCALSCALALRAPAPAPPHRDVATSAGTVRGYLAPHPPHYTFLGLPYARATAGAAARFKSAERGVRWDGVLEATHRVRCAQAGRRRDAACRVLNVFAPERAQRRPVLVHLHAGDFATGWGSHTAPPRLLSLGFVVVTLNYRLGVEGFLCLGTGGAPGNAGLKDQAAAMAWVHANIDKFGGDPAEVTLYGTGAGAAAAELLLLSGTIDGFMQRVIMESGSALAPTSLAADPVAAALDVAEWLGYENDESKTVDDLTTFYQYIAIEKTLNFSNRFTPCVENVAEYYSALLVKDPREILQSGILKPVPLLIAYSKERSLDDDNTFHNLPNNFEDLLPNNLEFESTNMKIKIGDQVKESYFGDLKAGVDVVESFESYANDIFTVYPIVKSATLHAAASSSPVYLMEFFPRDESNTIYEYIFSKDTFSEAEELIAEKLVTMWSNFMMYSDPTPLETSLLPVVWLPVTFRVKNEKPDISTASCLLFHLGQATMAMGTTSSGHMLPIWDHIYENFYKSSTPNLEISESEVAMYDENFAFIYTLSQHSSGREGGTNEDGDDGKGNDESVNDGGRTDESIRNETNVDHQDENESYQNNARNENDNNRNHENENDTDNENAGNQTNEDEYLLDDQNETNHDNGNDRNEYDNDKGNHETENESDKGNAGNENDGDGANYENKNDSEGNDENENSSEGNVENGNGEDGGNNENGEDAGNNEN